MATELLLQSFDKGVQNNINPEIMDPEAFQNSNNFINNKIYLEFAGDKKILINNIPNLKNIHAVKSGIIDRNYIFIKNGSKLSYIVLSDINNIQTEVTDLLTDLDEDSNTYYVDYAPTAGRFLFVFDSKRIFRICYNMNTPTIREFTTFFDSTQPIPFGYPFIVNERMFIGAQVGVGNNIYLSKIDSQAIITASNLKGSYEQVTNQSIGVVTSGQITGTLSPVNNPNSVTVFNLVLIIGTENLYDDGYGNIVNKATNAKVGTINYTSRNYTFTSTSPAGTEILATYKAEPVPLVLDFGYSSERQPSEGNRYQQNNGNGAIQQLVNGLDGDIYSFRNDIVYVLQNIDTVNDLFSNNIYRENIGIINSNSAVATSKGILVLDTQVNNRPRIILLERNITGSDVVPVEIASQFFLRDYNMNNAILQAWSKYVILCCATLDSTYNNVMLFVDLEKKTVQKFDYSSQYLNTFGQYLLSINKQTNTLEAILEKGDVKRTGYFITRNEKFLSENLKTCRQIILYYQNSGSNNIKLYISFDNSTYKLVKTLNISNSLLPFAGQLGEEEIGTSEIGGDKIIITNNLINDFDVANIIIPQRSFRTISIKLEIDGNGGFVISGIKYSKVKIRNLSIPYSQR